MNGCWLLLLYALLLGMCIGIGIYWDAYPEALAYEWDELEYEV